MSRAFIAGALILALLALPSAVPQSQPPQDRERVEKLEKRIAELELHVAMLEAYLKSQNPKFAAGLEKGLTAAKVTTCANNLRQLYMLQFTYMSKFGGRMKAMPSATGSAFWLALTKT